MFGFHEIFHLWAMKRRGYHAQGIVVYFYGLGPIPNRNIELADSTFVYFAGFLSMILPFIYYLFSPDVLVLGLLLLFSLVLSILDVKIWWDIKTEERKRKHF